MGGRFGGPDPTCRGGMGGRLPDGGLLCPDPEFEDV